MLRPVKDGIKYYLIVEVSMAERNLISLLLNLMKF